MAARLARRTCGRRMALVRPCCELCTAPTGSLRPWTAPSPFWKATAAIADAASMWLRAATSDPSATAAGSQVCMSRRDSRAMPSHIGWYVSTDSASMACVTRTGPLLGKQSRLISSAWLSSAHLGSSRADRVHAGPRRERRRQGEREEWVGDHVDLRRAAGVRDAELDSPARVGVHCCRVHLCAGPGRGRDEDERRAAHLLHWRPRPFELVQAPARPGDHCNRLARVEATAATHRDQAVGRVLAVRRRPGDDVEVGRVGVHLAKEARL
mmetsp:Transcript_36655/g.121426  ORF Transcript_36655/g.121426 Transcript_36655/m.121426 type:complete len:268 (-) Transcript_36655:299-1102(-)